MHKPEDYRAITLWGQYLGSQEPYITTVQEKAAAEGAPLDAIYLQIGGANWGKSRWMTVRDLSESNPFRQLYERTYPA